MYIFHSILQLYINELDQSIVLKTINVNNKYYSRNNNRY